MCLCCSGQNPDIAPFDSPGLAGDGPPEVARSAENPPGVEPDENDEDATDERISQRDVT